MVTCRTSLLACIHSISSSFTISPDSHIWCVDLFPSGVRESSNPKKIMFSCSLIEELRLLERPLLRLKFSELEQQLTALNSLFHSLVSISLSAVLYVSKPCLPYTHASPHTFAWYSCLYMSLLLCCSAWSILFPVIFAPLSPFSSRLHVKCATGQHIILASHFLLVSFYFSSFRTSIFSSSVSAFYKHIPRCETCPPPYYLISFFFSLIKYKF